jgi:hypothetical protein
MSDVNSYSQLREEYPELREDEIIELLPDDHVAEFRIGDFEVNNPRMLHPDEPVPKASMGGFTVDNSTEDTDWEIEAFGFEMNDRDDFFTVGIVVVVALLFYVAKLSVDHWFNKRLELYKKKLEKD